MRRNPTHGKPGGNPKSRYRGRIVFREIVERQQAEFFAKQSALIDAMGDKFKSVIERMPKVPGLSHGEPPYIVDDGDNALLLVAETGKWLRLAPDFRLSEDSVNEGYDAIYCLPVMGFGTIRLIPANSGYDFQETAVASSTPHEFDTGFYEVLDKLFAGYSDAVMSLAREYFAAKLMTMRDPLLALCAANDISVKDALATPGIVETLFSSFGESLMNASAKIAQGFEHGDEQTDEEGE